MTSWKSWHEKKASRRKSLSWCRRYIDCERNRKMQGVQEGMFLTSEYITAAIGVGGTLLGTILGWVLNNLSSKGKLKIFVSYWTDSFKYNDDRGSMAQSNSIEQTELYSYRLCLNIYNSSSEPKIMRSIKIVFNDGRNDVYSETPRDDRTRQNNGPIAHYNEVAPLTIQPKTVLEMRLHGGLWKRKNEELSIWTANKVFIEFRDDRNRKRRKQIKTEDYSMYFKNHPHIENKNAEDEM